MSTEEENKVWKDQQKEAVRMAEEEVSRTDKDRKDAEKKRRAVTSDQNSPLCTGKVRERKSLINQFGTEMVNGVNG